MFKKWLDAAPMKEWFINYKIEKKPSMTIFLFAFLIPLLKGKRIVMKDPFTRNIIICNRMYFFTFYFRLRRSFQDPFDFVVDFFKFPYKQKQIMTYEQMIYGVDYDKISLESL